METPSDTRTSITLLLRLRDLSDQEAWAEFVDRYTPKVYGWCRRHGLQETDAADVAQTVLLKLVAAMGTFEYDRSRGSFRAWLKTVTNNVIRDLAESWSSGGRGSGDPNVHQALAAVEARDELAAELQADAERELWREAEERVRLRVKSHTFEAYRLAAVDGLPAAKVADRLGIGVDQVYLAKSRVLSMLREEVERMDHPDPYGVT